jgi:hypothetical protein
MKELLVDDLHCTTIKLICLIRPQHLVGFVLGPYQ